MRSRRTGRRRRSCKAQRKEDSPRQLTAVPSLDRLGGMAGTDRIQVSSRILTIPNLLSLIRLGLVPVFLVFIIVGADFAALIVLAVSGVTDYLDGTIARKFQVITRLGQLLDPAADRLFIIAALVGLCVRDIIPLWLVIIIVGRDFMLIILGIILANHGYGPLPVHHLGKMGTF